MQTIQKHSNNYKKIKWNIQKLVHKIYSRKTSHLVLKTNVNFKIWIVQNHKIKIAFYKK